MITETLYDGKHIDKLGFGTWSIGGSSSADPSSDESSLAALRSAIEIGYRHFDTAEFYGAGHSERLLGQAIKESGVPREDFFITTKISPGNLGEAGTHKSFERSLRHLAMAYIDLYLIHWPRANMPLAETVQAFDTFIEDGRLRYFGVSNFSVQHMQQISQHTDTPLLTNQVPYSLHDRSYVDNGVLDYCQSNDILLTAYSPVGQGSFRSGPVLERIAQAHAATPYQIALAWLVQQPHVITIPMSRNPQHQKDNFVAADIVLSADEIAQLNDIT